MKTERANSTTAAKVKRRDGNGSSRPPIEPDRVAKGKARTEGEANPRVAVAAKSARNRSPQMASAHLLIGLGPRLDVPSLFGGGIPHPSNVLKLSTENNSNQEDASTANEQPENIDVGRNAGSSAESTSQELSASNKTPAVQMGKGQLSDESVDTLLTSLSSDYENLRPIWKSHLVSLAKPHLFPSVEALNKREHLVDVINRAVQLIANVDRHSGVIAKDRNLYNRVQEIEGELEQILSQMNGTSEASEGKDPRPSNEVPF